MEVVNSSSFPLFLHSRWSPAILFGLGFISSVLIMISFNFGTIISPQSSLSTSSESRSSELLLTPSSEQLAGPVWSFFFRHSSRSGNNSVHSTTGKHSDASALPVINNEESMSSSALSRLKNSTACDIFTGKWVEDDTYPLYEPDTCPFVDKKFNCQQNGRQDDKYLRWRWAPSDCNLQRFNGKNMLEILRGKRLVFVGDSLNRNQWESMLCMLRNSLSNQSGITHKHGSNRILSFLDYNCTVEFYKSRYLVDMNEGSGESDYTISLDRMDKMEVKWRKADVLIFNTAHWWGPGKIGNGENRFQEGDKIHRNLDVNLAYKRALFTWANWVDAHVDPLETVVFFRTYSPKHFRGGAWNAGGHCEDETEPSHEDSDSHTSLSKIKAIEDVLGSMKVPVRLLNVTKLSAYRKDAHPSIYWHTQRLNISQQDCGHWCLPGLPDTWNELLYNDLISLLA